MPRTQEGVDEYLDQVKESISHEKGWEVKNKVYLGFFSFTKFVMYKDLDPESWPEDMPLEENPLIKAIFDPTEEELSPGFQEDQVDVKLSSRRCLPCYGCRFIPDRSDRRCENMAGTWWWRVPRELVNPRP